MMGDGGDSDAEGDGYKTAVPVIQLLVNVKLVDMNSSTRGGHIPNQQS